MSSAVVLCFDWPPHKTNRSASALTQLRNTTMCCVLMFTAMERTGASLQHIVGYYSNFSCWFSSISACWECVVPPLDGVKSYSSRVSAGLRTRGECQCVNLLRSIISWTLCTQTTCTYVLKYEEIRNHTAQWSLYKSQTGKLFFSILPSKALMVFSVFNMEMTYFHANTHKM